MRKTVSRAFSPVTQSPFPSLFPIIFRQLIKIAFFLGRRSGRSCVWRFLLKTYLDEKAAQRGKSVYRRSVCPCRCLGGGRRRGRSGRPVRFAGRDGGCLRQALAARIGGCACSFPRAGFLIQGDHRYGKQCGGPGRLYDGLHDAQPQSGARYGGASGGAA